MSALSPKIDAAIDAVRGRTIPGTFNAVSLGLVGWGVLALAYGLFGGDLQLKSQTWGALLTAMFYAFGLCQGAVVFSGVLTGTQARWGRPLKRVAEAFAFFLPFTWLGLLLVASLGSGIYPWHPEAWAVELGAPAVNLAPHGQAPAAKELWLTPGFFFVRQIIGIGLLFALQFVYLRASLKPDLIAAKARLGADAPGWWSFFTGSDTDAKAASESGQVTQSTLVPFLGFAYAIIYSIASFDLLMSLDPWWFSNMFGGWLFMSSFWLGMVAVGAATVASRDWLSLNNWITPNITLDLGKLILAGCMFWAYTLYAQILPIYYTNVPEETNYLLVRLMLDEWSWMSRLVAVLCFLAPFTILLSRGIKKMRWPFFVLCALIMTGLFFERTLLVMPSVYLDRTFPWVSFLIVNVGIFAGTLGALFNVWARVIAQTPAVPVTDPYLDDHPWDVHVHSLDDAHAHH